VLETFVLEALRQCLWRGPERIGAQGNASGKIVRRTQRFGTF